MPPWLWSPSGGTPGAGRFCPAGSCNGGTAPGSAGAVGTAASAGIILAGSGRGSRFDEWRAERRSAGCLMGASRKEGRRRSGRRQITNKILQKRPDSMLKPGHSCLMRCNAYSGDEICSQPLLASGFNAACPEPAAKHAAFRSAPEADRRSVDSAVTAARASGRESCPGVLAATAAAAYRD